MTTLLHGRDRCRFEDFPVEQTAELSRFAVSKQFRKRRGEERSSTFGQSEVLETETRLMPFISLGLIRGMFGICLEHGITHLAAVMEPPLVRILHRLGLDFMPIGGTVMHHGLRQPCFAVLDELIQQADESDSLVWQYAFEPLLRKQHQAGWQARHAPERVTQARA
jgi:N-acyl amino acid synthase of PEP-CTERM/exosortase system